MEKSPRIVPGALSRGLVAPSIVRPVATTFLPSHTIATTGPLVMYSINLGKKGLSWGREKGREGGRGWKRAL